MTSRTARVIIPLALASWLGALVLIQPGIPAAARIACIGAFVLAVPVIVFYLMSQMGWSALAGRFRARTNFRGPWTACPTGQMAHVSVHDPTFDRNRLRLVGGTLRVGTTPAALHISMLFSRIPILGSFFPDIEIPWSAVTRATAFEAPGWFRPQSRPGLLLQAGYDPNYTGTFVELEVGTPPVFIQLPGAIVGEGIASLDVASAATGGASVAAP